MAKASKPTAKVQEAIYKQQKVKSPSAKQAVEKALYVANTPVAKVRERLDAQSTFFLKLLLEFDNRIQIIGRESNGWIEASPDIADAILKGEIKGVERPSGQGTFTALIRDGVIGKLSSKGKFTGLNFKELQKVKNLILAEQAESVEGGHQVALATQKLEVTFNILNGIDLRGVDKEEAAYIQKIKNAIQKGLDLLVSIDKIDAKLAREVFGGDKGAAIGLLDAIASGQVTEYKYETSSTTATDFTKEALKQDTTIELEDKDINQLKGRGSKQIITALNGLLIKSLDDNKNLSPVEKELANYVNLGNSLSYMQAVEQTILHRAIGKRFNGGTSRKKVATRRDTLLSKKQRVVSKRLSAPRKIGGDTRQKNPFANIGRLLGFINKELPNTVIKNMGRPSLENQTGRFARSAQVLSALPTSNGLITFNYTYDNRYRVFEPEQNDGRYPASYDPRDLISKSIRDLAISQAQFKFITRRV